jgi:hypothetical protein
LPSCAVSIASYGRRRLRRRGRAADAADREHAAGRREQRRLEHAGLLRGTRETRRDGGGAALGERQRHLRGLAARFLQQVVERAAAEIEPAFERAVHAHVEPALDALAQELHRHRVHERAGQHGDQREQQHEAQREA